LSARPAKAELKKRKESAHVERLAKLLNADWRIQVPSDERIAPDFIVTESTGSFGLEHTQVFKDALDRSAGSQMKSAESRRQSRLTGIGVSVSAAMGFPIKLLVSSERKYVDEDHFAFDDCSNEQLEAAVLSSNLKSHELNEPPLKIETRGVTIFASRRLRNEVEFIQDRVGFVGWGEGALKAAIAAKSAKLPKYRSEGLVDIRLLVVSDRLFNSGKLNLTHDAVVDRMGFDIVYFLSYPDEVLTF